MLESKGLRQNLRGPDLLVLATDREGELSGGRFLCDAEIGAAHEFIIHQHFRGTF
jgi:hypothetical protein